MVQTMSLAEDMRKERIGPFYEAPRYPDTVLDQPMADNNILFVTDDSAAGDEALAKAQALGLNLNSVAADPMFVDLEKGDFRFKDGSPALRLGIAPITKYGIQEPYGLTEEYGYVGN